jgi:hypothetical protein
VEKAVIDQDLELVAQLIREQHHTEVTGQDLAEVEAWLWEQRQDRQLGLMRSDQPGYLNPDLLVVIEVDLDYDIGKAIGFIVGAVLGVIFLPGLGLAAGWLQGALIGGAIGYNLVRLFEGKPQDSSPVKSLAATNYTFAQTGGLVRIGEPIPKVYGNRSINPVGGVYLKTPGQIYNRLRSGGGSRYLDTLFLLGVGRLGEVRQQGLKISDKPISDFLVGDITTDVAPGLSQQSNLGGIADYCQSVAVSTNAFIGTSPAAKVGTGLGTGIQFGATNAASANIVGLADISKSISTNAWDAGLWDGGGGAVTHAGYGSYIRVATTIFASTTLAAGARVAIGLNATTGPASFDPAASTFTLEVNAATNTWIARDTGTTVGTGALSAAAIAKWTAGLTIEVRHNRSHPSLYLQAIIDNVEVLRYAKAIDPAWHTYYGIYRAGDTTSLVSVEYGGPRATDISPGVGSRFSIAPTALNALKSGQTYQVGGSGVTLVGKDTANNWVEFSQELWITDSEVLSSAVSQLVLSPSSSLKASYRAASTTSKAVTNIDVILNAAIWARDASGNITAHAQAFRIGVAPVGGAVSWLKEFIIISKSEGNNYRSIEIAGLPKAIYTVRIEPISDTELTADILSIEDQQVRTTISTTANIGGQPQTVIAEVGRTVPVSEARSLLSFTGKPQTSSDSGPSMQITHLNEIVSAPAPPIYNGFTIGYAKAIASDRIQSAPAYSWDIPQGSLCRNFLAAGQNTAATGNSLSVYPRLPPLLGDSGRRSAAFIAAGPSGHYQYFMARQRNL